MSTTPPPPGPQRSPIPGPRNPFDQPNPHREVLSELAERVQRQLESAVAESTAAAERARAASGGARGEAMEGQVVVRVDGKGLLASADFGPETATLTAEELRNETLLAVEDARDNLGLGRPSPDAIDQLDQRPVAAALLRLLGKED